MLDDPNRFVAVHVYLVERTGAEGFVGRDQWYTLSVEDVDEAGHGTYCSEERFQLRERWQEILASREVIE